MPAKAAKLWARVADRLRINGSHRVYWHLGRPNFGDDINPWFYSRLSGADHRWGGSDRTHVLGIGSIAAKLSGLSVVMGSGFIEPVLRTRLARPASVLAVRGELSAEILGGDIPHLGDPLSLIDLLLPAPAPAPDAPWGFVPHARNYHAYREALRRRPEITVIDPRAKPLAVVAAIGRCARVASQSLHGLIVADAYRIPSQWIAPTDVMVGGEFKFRDYFTTLDRPKSPVPFAAFLARPDDVPFERAAYRHNKAAYLRALTEALRPPPAD